MSEELAADALMGPGLAARTLQLSVARVRQLDDVLTPLITADNRRLYRRDVVERYAAVRAELLEARAKAKAAAAPAPERADGAR